MKVSGKYVIGYNDGITGPNASLTVGIDTDKFVVISRAYYDGNASKLVALVPRLEGNADVIAQLIVDGLNDE